MQHLLELVASHPLSALALVGAVAFAESLAIVGTFVPAAVVMLGAGALVAHGAIGLWPTLLVAVAGAILGDALSYELGRRHGERLRSWRLLQERQSALQRSQAFVTRHGGKSVVLARFMGAVRAFVPLLAGLTQMPRGRFYVMNVGSAILWAPAHILPGVVFGNSLQLAEQVGGRLLVALLLLVAVLWAAVVATRSVLRYVVPFLRRMRDCALQRARSRGGWPQTAAIHLLDPGRPDASTLLLSALAILAGAGLLLDLIEDVLTGDQLVQVDLSVFQFLQGLRTEALDRWMVGLTELGSVGVLLPLILVVLVWLLARGCRQTARYWIAAAVFGEAAVQVLKVTLGRSRPLQLYEGLERFSFPSGHATMSTVVIGTFAFLVSRGAGLRVRLAIATVAASFVALIAFSRLYLGAHWLSDVAGGISLGTAWIGLVAVVYTSRGISEPLHRGLLASLGMGTILLAGAGWILTRMPLDLRRYERTSAVTTLELQQWIAGGWQKLPSHRIDIGGEQEEVLPLQWACRVDELEATLRAAGWRPADPFHAATALAMLAPGSSIADWPVLPRLDAGRVSRPAWIRTAQPTGEREVLRLWRTAWDVRTPAGALPLWRGAVYSEHVVAADAGFRKLQSVPVSSVESSVLFSHLPGVRNSVRRSGAAEALLLECSP